MKGENSEKTNGNRSFMFQTDKSQATSIWFVLTMTFPVWAGGSDVH